MSTTIQLLRSDVYQQRPNPAVLANGVPMVNLNEIEPGLFFAARDGSLFKVGPAAVGDEPPNSSPQGQIGNCRGELWIDTSGTSPELKFFDGSSFVPTFTPPQSVTSVGLTFSDLFSVANSPVTSSGTLLATLVSQTANTVFAAPVGVSGVPSFRVLEATDIPDIPAAKVTSGVFDTGRIPGLDASKIVSGSFPDARIPSLNASKITSGVFPFTLGGTGIASTPQNGELLIGDSSGWSKSTLTAGTNLSVVNGAGSITIDLNLNPVFSSVAAPSFELQSPSSDTVTLEAPALLGSYTLKLPQTDGTNGSVLTTDGAGQLTFESSLFGLTSVGGLANITINAGGANGDVVLAPTGSGVIDASSARIVSLAPPTHAGDAANKAYVDTIASGIQPKAQVRVASTADIDLATGGLLTIDTIPLNPNDRVLVKNQTLPEENGIYEAGVGAWTRTADANTFSELVGAVTFVSEGVANLGKTFLCDSPAGGTIGVDPVNWIIFSSNQGTVTSVGLSMPSGFSVASSPVTSSGTLTVTYSSQSANRVFAGPAGGGAATPSFRALVAADIPATLNSHTFAGAATFQSTVTLGDGASDTVTVVGNATFQNSATFDGISTFNGAVTLGDNIGDTITVIGTPTFQNDTAFQGKVTLGNSTADYVSINGQVDTDILPVGTVNLGSSTDRWDNIYTNDLHLSNEGHANDVDGTWGSFTIQEGEEALYLINRRTGKRYKFMLEEV